MPNLPSPQSIRERLREEFILAKAAVKGSAAAASAKANPAANDQASVEWEIDNESRELILIGEMLVLVARAGHIFRSEGSSDWGIDGEIEFKDEANNASGKRVYVQLKSGDSHLVKRKSDGAEVFYIKKARHLQYWQQQAYPVMLVIRQSSGLIRWMNVSTYLEENANVQNQIIFNGSAVTADSIRAYGTQLLGTARQ